MVRQEDNLLFVFAVVSGGTHLGAFVGMAVCGAGTLSVLSLVGGHIWWSRLDAQEGK